MFFQGELVITFLFLRYAEIIASYSQILMKHAYFESMLSSSRFTTTCYIALRASQSIYQVNF